MTIFTLLSSFSTLFHFFLPRIIFAFLYVYKVFEFYYLKKNFKTVCI